MNRKQNPAESGAFFLPVGRLACLVSHETLDAVRQVLRRGKTASLLIFCYCVSLSQKKNKIGKKNNKAATAQRYHRATRAPHARKNRVTLFR